MFSRFFFLAFLVSISIVSVFCDEDIQDPSAISVEENPVSVIRAKRQWGCGGCDCGCNCATLAPGATMAPCDCGCCGCGWGK